MGKEEDTTGVRAGSTAKESPEKSDASAATSSNFQIQPPQTMSKNQMKRLKRHAAQLEQRAIKRQLERQRRKETRKRAKESGELVPIERKRLKHIVKEPYNIRVVIDASYDNYMNEEQIKKLVKQIQHCYAINRRAETPFLYSVTSLNNKTQERLESLDGSSAWNIGYESESYDKLYNKENIIFLSAESDHTLTTLEDNKIYIIGGLVDHNRYKGLCHKAATDKNITTAKLPIADYLDMKSRKVLTIDHVFEILVRYQELKSWEEAFFKVIPKRKGYQSLTDNSTNQQESNSDSSSQTQSNSESAHHRETESGSVNQEKADCELSSHKHYETELTNHEQADPESTNETERGSEIRTNGKLSSPSSHISS